MTEKRRCVVTAIGKQSVFGKTDDNESVVMKRCAEGLQGVRRGDMVECELSKFRGGDSSTWIRPIKWFGNLPFIVARSPGTRGRTSAELSADEAAFSEALQ